MPSDLIENIVFTTLQQHRAVVRDRCGTGGIPCTCGKVSPILQTAYRSGGPGIVQLSHQKHLAKEIAKALRAI